MIVDEALAYLEGDGPMDYGSHPDVMPEVVAAIADADVSRDPALLARVRRLVHKATSHYRFADAVKRCWVRAELALGNHAAVAEEIFTDPTSGAEYFRAAATAGGDAWPFVRLLLDRGAKALGGVASSRLTELAAALVAPDVPGWEDRWSELCSRSVRFAADALAHVRRTRDIAIAGMLGPLIPRLDLPEGEHVVAAMQAAAREGESLAALAPLLDDRVLSGPRAEDVAYVLTLSSLGDGTTPRWLDDPRPAVRLGAVRALANDPRLITCARDPDETVRRAALVALEKRPLGPADVVALVSALDVAGDDLADILVGMTGDEALLAACDSVGTVAALRLATSLRRQHGALTRACTRCRRIPRSQTWMSDDRPAEIHQLSIVRDIPRAERDADDWNLRRCATCSSHYATRYECHDNDPFMRRESWTVQRLTLGELQRDYGPDVVTDWTAALVADLDHPDPHWRTEAAHELARDLVGAGRFDRIESELLRHPRRQVAREGLRALCAGPVDPPISAAVLEALAASTDEDTHAFATTLLTVQRGTLDELKLGSYAVLTAVGVLLGRGAAVSPRFAARFVEYALAATQYTWTIDDLVVKIAVAEHLPATLARLRAALGDPSTRSRALQLVKTLAKASLLDEETLAVALQQADTELEATLAVALAATTSVIPEIANRTLRSGEPHDARKVIGRLGEVLARGEDIGWAVAALGAHVLRHGEGFDAAVMLDQLATQGVDLTDAVQDLSAALDRVMPYSAQFATHALVRHHMRRAETDAVLALLSHGLSSIRSAAASVLADVRFELPAALMSRLQEMTTDRATHPRGAAERALRART